MDRNNATTWSTETYQNNVLTKVGSDKPGVGLYIDADPAFAARALSIRTTTPGWTAQIFGAADRVPAAWPDPGWRPLSAVQQVDREKVRITLDTAGRRYRYYLIWITALPPGKPSATISEVYLYKAKGSWSATRRAARRSGPRAQYRYARCAAWRSTAIVARRSRSDT